MFTNLPLLILGAWLFLLSGVLFYFWLLLRSLFTAPGRGLKHSIEDSIHKSQTLEKLVEELRKDTLELKEKNKNLLQKTAIVHFNPFERLGGEQSHTLAVLTDNKSGFLITSLYTREGVRVYLKEIQNKGVVREDLSAEEKEAINKALKQ